MSVPASHLLSYPTVYRRYHAQSGFADIRLSAHWSLIGPSKEPIFFVCPSMRMTCCISFQDNLIISLVQFYCWKEKHIEKIKFSLVSYIEKSVSILQPTRKDKVWIFVCANLKLDFEKWSVRTHSVCCPTPSRDSKFSWYLSIGRLCIPTVQMWKIPCHSFVNKSCSVLSSLHPTTSQKIIFIMTVKIIKSFAHFL
jgi:hypothetical protein